MLEADSVSLNKQYVWYTVHVLKNTLKRVLCVFISKILSDLLI